MSIFRHVANHSLWAILSLFSTALILLIALYAYMMLALPSVDSLRDVHLQVPLNVYSKEGQLMAQYGVKRRIPVTLDQVPKQLIQAVLATEDARFYDHPGIDVIGLVRAAVAVAVTGHKVQGASTITMQVARNFFLNREKTYTRKFNEILLALKIDKTFSKDKILALYLNKIYFGQRAYGVAAAAQVYYGKTLDQLTLPEMAMIAGLPKAPSSHNPIKNPKAALLRRNYVLTRMLEVGFINKSTYETAIKAPITAHYHYQPIALQAPYVSEMVRQIMVARYGDSAYDEGYRVYTTLDAHRQRAADAALAQGLIAYDERHGYRPPEENWGPYSLSRGPDWQASLKNIPVIQGLEPAVVVEVLDQSATAMRRDGSMVMLPWEGLSWARPYRDAASPGPKPQAAKDILKEGDVIRIKRQEDHWALAQLPKVQGALISLSPRDGAIEALSGGFDYELSHFNRAVQAVRQAGSNFKPFVYSAALDKGFTLATLINDAPVVIRDTGENEWWRPHNDTMKFYGPTTVRTGLTKSRNLVSIRLLQETGIRFTINYLMRFGFERAQLPHALSLALGSASVTPLQLARGYSVFANGGYRTEPYYIARIVDRDERTVYEAHPEQACTACVTQLDFPEDQRPQPLATDVISAQNAYLITDVLKGVITQGTAQLAKSLKRADLAGKTGTTNRQADAWFSGYNLDLEATVWVGFDDNQQSLHEYGAKAALPIWMDYMAHALDGTALSSLPEPPGIVRVRIDPTSGLLARATDKRAVFESFLEDHVPKHYASPATPQFSNGAPNPRGASSSGATEEAPLF